MQNHVRMLTLPALINTTENICDNEIKINLPGGHQLGGSCYHNVIRIITYYYWGNAQHCGVSLSKRQLFMLHHAQKASLSYKLTYRLSRINTYVLAQSSVVFDVIFVVQAVWPLSLLPTLWLIFCTQIL